MGSRMARGVICGFTLLAAGPALAQEDLAARVKKAQDAVRVNMESPQGREWMQRNRFASDRLMILLVNRCLPEPGGDIPTTFSVYLRLSKTGHASEILTELDAALGQCMTAAARQLPFPEAPRDDYWIQMNVAAPL